MSAEQLQLDTPRLLLRPPRIEDFGPWAALLADAEASHFIGVRSRARLLGADSW